MTDSRLYDQIESLPPDLKKEVADFVAFLKLKTKSVSENANVVKIRKFGSLKGKIHMSDDFDAPLDDFKDYMQ